MKDFDISKEDLKEVSDFYKDTLFQAIIDKKSNLNYDYNYDTINYIYTNLFDRGQKNTSEPYGLLYSFNENGYRSETFKPGTEMLVTGCSQTFGSGLPDEFRWGDILSNKLGLSYSNLAVPGSSVNRQVRDLFAYFKEYGHPKYIFAIFPVFNRMEMISNPKYFKPGAWERSLKVMKKNGSSSKKDVYRQTVNVNMIPRNQKFFTHPLIVEDVVSSETPQFYASIQIQMLQQYCDLAGIKLIWSTWHGPQNSVLKLVNDRYPETYKNFIDIQPREWNFNEETNESEYRKNGVLISCHEEYRDIFKDVFHMALDREFGIEWAHWGAHRHLHVAEAFEKYFNEEINND